MGRSGACTRERPLGQGFRRLEHSNDGCAAYRRSTQSRFDGAGPGGWFRRVCIKRRATPYWWESHRFGSLSRWSFASSTRGRNLGFASKVVCIQGDAHAIPLRSNCMDRITCRCGIMFFSDLHLVMSEMFRVLKSDGRVALLAWGAFEQPFFDAMIGPVLRLVRGAEMPPEAHTMFRFASPGSLERELRAAGLCSVREESLTLPRIWAGTPQDLWVYLQEIGTLCHPLFASIPPDLRARVDAEVSSEVGRFRNGCVVQVPARVIIASGQSEKQ